MNVSFTAITPNTAGTEAAHTRKLPHEFLAYLFMRKSLGDVVPNFVFVYAVFNSEYVPRI